jgi:hypothetical protein
MAGEREFSQSRLLAALKSDNSCLILELTFYFVNDKILPVLARRVSAIIP